MLFIHTFLVNNGKSRQNNQNEDTAQFEDAIYRVLHERSNINTSLAEQLKFQGKWTFIYSLWVNSGKLKKKKKKKKKIQNQDTLYLENAIYRVLHKPRSIAASFVNYLNFQKSKFYPFLLGEQWQTKIKKLKTKIRTLCIFKMLYIGYFFRAAVKMSRINAFYKYTLGRQ